MADEPPLQQFSEPKRRQLARIYQIWTNNQLISQDTEDSVMNELLTLKTHLRSVAIEYYGLEGIWVDIHAALVPEELVSEDGPSPYLNTDSIPQSNDPLDPKLSYVGYTVEELLGYIDIMHFKIDDSLREERNIIKIATTIIALKIRLMEGLRMHAFKCQILFGNHLNRIMIFPGITSMKKVMSGVDVQRLGCNYFYPQFGELNITDMRNRFDVQELIHMAGTLNALCVEKMKEKGLSDEDVRGLRFRVHSLLRLDDLISFVIYYAGYLEMDVRTYLTPLGPEINVVTEPYSSLTVVHDDIHLHYSDLLEVCSEDGISTHVASSLKGSTSAFATFPKPEEVLWEEFVVGQFSPNFASNPGQHRGFFEAAANAYLTDGTRIEDISEHDMEAEILYYGRRDGNSKMRIYTIRELADVFGDLADFYEPNSVRQNPTNPLLWTRFSVTSIRYLMRSILPHYPKSFYRQKLTRIIQRVLFRITSANSARTPTEQHMQLDILSRLKLNSDDMEKEQIADFFRKMYNAGVQFDDFWDEIDGYSMDSLASVTLERPLYTPPPETYTGRIAVKCRDILMYVEQKLQANMELYALITRLYVVKFFREVDASGTGFDWLENDVTDDGIVGFDEQPASVLDPPIGGSAYISYEEPYRIGNYLRLMYEFSKFNLIRNLIEAGKTLKMTAIYYQKQLSEIGIGDVHVIFSETSTDYEKFAPVDESSWEQ